MSERKVCLDLFAGLGGFSAAFEGADDWDVLTVEIEERFDPDYQTDVFDLRPSELLEWIGEYDVLMVLASPPCQYLNTAGNHDKWDFDRQVPIAPESRHAVALFHHAVGLIHALAPDYWFVENPRASRIRWSFRPPDTWVTYCQYGTNYQKPTGLWGSFPPMTFRRCAPGDACHVSNTEHDGHEAINSMNDLSQPERAKVPYDLSESIRDATDAGLAGEVAEQHPLTEF